MRANFLWDFFCFQHEKLKKEIGSSILKAIAAGISSEGQPKYVEILNSSLVCAADYTGPNTTLVHFYEFYILVPLMSF